MRTAFHFFKRDLRRTWWLLALWSIIYAAEALQATFTIPQISEWRQGLAALSLTFLLFPGLHLIVLALVVAFVVFADPPADASAFWITRPVSRLELLVAKTASLVVLVSVPVVATAFAVAQFLPATGSLSLALLCAAGHELCFILPLAAMTAIVPNLRWYGVAILGIAAFIVASLITGYFTSGSSLLIDPYDAAALRTTKTVIGDLLIVAGGGFVFAYQYLRRRAAYSVRIAALVVAAYFGVSNFWPWRFGISRQLPSDRAPVEQTRINLKATAVSTGNFNLNGVVSTGIDGPVEIEGIPKAMYYVVRTSSPRLKLSNGAVVKTLDGIPVVQTGELSPSALSSVVAALGGIPVRTYQSSSSNAALARIEGSLFERFKNEPAELVNHFDVVIGRYVVVAELPIEKGQQFEHGGMRSEISTVVHRPDEGVTIDVIDSLVAQGPSSISLAPGAESRDPRLGGDPVFILLNRARREAVTVNTLISRGTSNQFYLGMVLVKQIRELPFGGKQDGSFPNIDAEWIRNAKLVCLEPKPLFEIIRTTTIHLSKLGEPWATGSGSIALNGESTNRMSPESEVSFRIDKIGQISIGGLSVTDDQLKEILSRVNSERKAVFIDASESDQPDRLAFLMTQCREAGITKWRLLSR
jgi:hypothetical protein